MTSEVLEKLLEKSESPRLDFKLEHYDFSGPTKEEKLRKLGAFAKDIIAFSNTPSAESAFIVIGVKRLSNGQLDLKGVAHHPDDNELQQLIDSVVYPRPHFCYHQVEHQGKQFGLIEISPTKEIGPFQAKRAVPGAGLDPNALYLRLGSQNATASHEEKKRIYAWFNKEDRARHVGESRGVEWESFVSSTDLAEPGVHYVLILAPELISKLDLFRHLAWVDWNLVVDLDPNSELDGVLKQCKDSLEAHRALHRVTILDPLSGNLNRSTTWYFARGLHGRDKTIATGSYSEWNKKYGLDSRQKLERFASTLNAPVRLLALCSNTGLRSHVRNLMESAASVFGDRLSMSMVTDNKATVLDLKDDLGAQAFSISTPHFLEGLSLLENSRELGPSDLVQFPSSSGIPKELAFKDVAWLEEDLELVHLNVGKRNGAGVEPVGGFLKGGVISWFDLGLQADVEREKTPKILATISRDLQTARAARINVYHHPGAGGSTIARRLLWMLHWKFPTVILKQCDFKQTVERLTYLASVCDLPLLILREGSQISDSEADALAETLASRHLASVLLQVVRRYAVENEGERRFFINAKLSDLEANRFCTILENEVPVRAPALRALSHSAIRDRERTPFIFGLTAYQEDYTGLHSFVAGHLSELSGTQKKMLLFFAIAHTYGQQVLRAQFFSEMLSIPDTRIVDLKSVLSAAALGLLVDTGAGWRTSHELVAREILLVLLGEGLADERNWNTRLADIACEFVDFCRTNRPVHSYEMQSIVDRVFYYRVDTELLGNLKSGDNLFSELISEIPPDGRFRVLDYIVKSFPDNAHYWAHLGRYYSIQLKDFDKALIAIDHAIKINDKDNVLFHIKGMALRNSVYQKMQNSVSIREVLPEVKRAAECFAEARKLNPDEDFGYISEVQLITKVLDYAKKGDKEDGIRHIANLETDPWLLEAFQQAELLLMLVQQHRVGEQSSEYEERCRAELDALYGSHEMALQRWQNLLDRRDNSGRHQVFAPPIRRQIVLTHLARCERRWDKMSKSSIVRAIELLEENLKDEPSNDRNLRLWIQGARFLSNPPSLDLATERIAYWKANGESLDSLYYLFVLRALKALNGSIIEADGARLVLEQVRALSRYHRNRTKSPEWLGKGTGLNQLVHQNMLGEWNHDLNFWGNTRSLATMTGIVTSISGPQAGEIELAGGLKAFFVPGLSNLVKGRDENVAVSSFLGFSYDGLRAWSVAKV